MTKTRVELPGRMGRASAAALNRQQIQAVVRRFGFVLQKAFEMMMSRLIADGEERLAETLNDSLKPAVDWLLHFELEETSNETKL